MTLELEQQLLGTLLLYPESIHQCDLLESHFGESSHREIYGAILHKVAARELVSVPSLAVELGRDYASYLTKLVAMPTLLDLANACELIKESNRKIIIDLVASNMLENLRAGGKTAEALATMAGLIESETADRHMHNAAQVTEEVLNDMLNTVKPFSTGIRPLDEVMGGGMYPRKAYGLCARKKVGKTVMLGTISHNLNLAGVKHLFICGEMGEKEIQQRVLCRVMNAYPSAFREPSQYLKDRVMDYMKICPKNTIYLDAPGITFDKLKHAVVTAYMKYGIKGFILDYWQLVSGKNGRDTEAFHLGETAQWIAEIGRKLDIFSITAAQINQEGNTRGGEGLRLAFDQVYQLHRPDITDNKAWVEMMDTRYTPWMNIGSGDDSGVIEPGLELNDRGPYFEEPQMNGDENARYPHA